MVILKFGENLQIGKDDFISSESIKADKKIHDRFVKFAKEVKKIAPKADDFLYFTAVMMHAAERSAYDDNGNIRKDSNGKDVEVGWDVDSRTGSWRWKSSDPNILPYKNNNCDIFPEAELKKAYKKWIGKPLCKDHQSSSVDGMRGLIIDTYWDDKNKRIVALCALDKVSYPELARHVKNGVAADVSMGTGVSQSICSECGNVATTESEYCNHVRNKTAYGEINVGLNPIELSIVMNGADRKAKVLEVLAAAQKIEDKVSEQELAGNMTEILAQYNKLAFRVEELEKEILNARNDNNFALKRTASSVSEEDESYLSLIKHKLSNLENILTSIYKDAKKPSTEDLMVNSIKQGYWQGTEEPKPGQKQYEAEEADSIRNTQDSHMKGPLTDLSPAAGTEIPKQDLEVKKQVSRASVEERRAIRAAALERAQLSLKKAYQQGTDETKKYPVDPLAEKARKEDSHLKNPNTDGKYPEDEKVKKEVARASVLKARLVTEANASDNRWEVCDKRNGDVIFTASFEELAGKKVAMYKPLYKEDFAQHLMRTIKAVGLKKANELFKGGQVAEPVPTEPAPMPMEAPAEPAPETEVSAELEEPPPGDVEKEGTPEGDVGAALNATTKALEGLGDVIENVLPGMQDAIDVMKGEEEGFGGADLEEPDVAVNEALAELNEPTAEPTVASLNKVRIVLNAGLKKAFNDSIKTLETCKEEISLLKDAAKNKSVNTDVIQKLAADANKDAKKAIKDAEVLRLAFVKYAKSVYAIEKRAALEQKMQKKAQLENKVETQDVKLDEVDKDTEELDEVTAKFDNFEKEFNMKTAEGRKASRHKLAASVASKIQFSEMLQKAHPKGGTKLEGISDTKENYVEDVREVASKVQESVSHEPKVKSAAEKLNKLISEGKIDASNLDALVKEGLDSEVANYWKKYYGQVDGGSEFAASLLKDYSKSVSKEKKAEMEENLKAKTIRAFDLAYQMAEVGLCGKTQTSIRKEAEKILSYDDNAYASVKRVVDHHTRMNKTASSRPIQVGVALDTNDSEDSNMSLYQQLTLAFSDSK